MSSKELPEKLSDLIYLALDDLEKIEQDYRYVINMGEWYKWHQDKNVCAVCFAGAVMAGTMGVTPPTTELEIFEFRSPSPGEYGEDTMLKLYALDDIRRGNRDGFMTALQNIFNKGYMFRDNWPVTFAPLVECLLLPTDPESVISSSERSPFDFPSYEKNPEMFKAGVRQVADVLAQHGF